MHADLRNHTVDHVTLGAQPCEQRPKQGIRETIELGFFENQLLGAVHASRQEGPLLAQRRRRLLLTYGPGHAVMRVHLELRIIFGVRTSGRNDERRSPVQLGYFRQDEFRTRHVESAGRVHEINLRVDVEEDRFHSALVRKATAAPGSPPRDISAPCRTDCAWRAAASESTPRHTLARLPAQAAARSGSLSGSPDAATLAPLLPPHDSRCIPTSSRSHHGSRSGIPAWRRARYACPR